MKKSIAIAKHSGAFLAQMLVALLGAWLPSQSLAADANQTFAFQARIYTTGATPLTSNNVTLDFRIFSTDGLCLLYHERQTNFDLSATDGRATADVGSSTGALVRVAGSDPGLAMTDIFYNSGSQLRAPGSTDCAAGYTPAAGQNRVLRVTWTDVNSATTDTLDDIAINSVPVALVAQSVEGKRLSSLIQTSATVTQANLTQLTDGSTTALHNHAGAYVPIGGSGTVNLGSGDVYTSGKFGVGVTAPAAPFHVELASYTLPGGGLSAGTAGIFTNTGDTNLTVFSGAANTGSINFGDTGSIRQGFVDYSHTDDSLSLGTAGTQRLYISSGGSVGIGTTSTGARLSVASDSGVPLSVGRYQNTGNGGGIIISKAYGTPTAPSEPTAATVIGSLLFDVYEPTTGFSGGSSAAADARISAATEGIPATGDVPTYLSFATKGAASANSAERMRISSSGYVGIGVTSPVDVLHLTRTGDNTFQRQLRLHNYDSTNNGSSGVGIAFKTAAVTGDEYYKGAIGFQRTAAGGLGNLHFMLDNVNDISNADFADSKMAILGSGNVGIGTTAPDFGVTYGSVVRVLGIAGDGSANAGSTGTLALANNRATPTVGDTAGSVDFISVGNGSGVAQLGARVKSILSGSGGANGFGHDLAFYTKIDNAAGISEKMRVLASGNVGIGTTAPAVTLDVSKSSTSNTVVGSAGYPLIRAVNSNTTAGDGTTTHNYAGLRASAGNGTVTGDLFASYNSGGLLAEGIYLRTTTNHNLYLQTNTTTRMAVNTAGNVGIGTETPSSLLEVSGIAAIDGTTPTTLTISGRQNSNGWTTDAAVANLDFHNNDATLGGPGVRARFSAITENANGSQWGITFSTSANNATPTEKLRITSIGNVGIGTTNPGYKLDVQGGDINASGSVRSAGVALTSDLRFKRDIQPLHDSLNRLLRLRGVSYQWRTEEFPERKFNERTQVGVIAQEVEKEFPELVDTDAKGFKSVNYPALVAPLIEATRELHGVCSATDAKVETVNREIASLRAQMTQIRQENAALKAQAAEAAHQNAAIQAWICARDPQAPFCH